MIKVTGADGIRYIIDGERYWPEEALKEALGCKDDDIFGEIKKLKEDKDLLEELHSTNISQLKDYADLGLELGIGSGDAESIKDYIISLKKERDKLKEKYDKLKKRANAMYGAYCGYSADKEPAFRCNVISYSWELGSIHDVDSIRVELDLTPNANYKGTFDMEDLKRYIEDYGREKKLGVLESVDYQNAKAARAELAHLYKKVLGKEKLDRDLSPHEVMKAILDEYKRVRDSRCDFLPCESPSLSADFLRKKFKQFCEQHKVAPLAGGGSIRDWIQYIFEKLVDYRDLADGNYKKAEGFRKEKRAVEDSLAELRAKIREIYRSIVDDEWDEHLSYTSALNDINEEYKRVVHNFEERTADWSKAQQEYSRYRLAVGSLLDIPKEASGDINAIERSFTFSKKKYESLKEFRDNVCEIFDIPSNMTDNYILKEIHDIVDRYDELEDFRADICGALDIEGMLGTPKQNDKYILEQVEKLKESASHDKLFRDSVCDALDTTTAVSDSYLFKKIEKLKLDHKEIQEKYSRYCLAVGSLCNIPAEHREDISWIEDAFNHTKKDYLKWKDDADRLARLRSNICTALCLGGETSDEDILKRVRMTRDCHDKLCKDYTELHDDYVASQKQVKGFTNRCDSLENLRRDLWEFRKNAIEDLKNRDFFFRPEENETLPEIFIKLLKRYDDCFSRYKEQHRLRQMWHVRWESENERANGVQKKLDKLRGIEAERDKYKENCKYWSDMYSSSEAACGALKGKIRELKDEKTKVISAIGQDIWDDCLK